VVDACRAKTVHLTPAWGEASCDLTGARCWRESTNCNCRGGKLELNNKIDDFSMPQSQPEGTNLFTATFFPVRRSIQ
jgi:hypothetical protein